MGFGLTRDIMAPLWWRSLFIYLLIRPQAVLDLSEVQLGKPSPLAVTAPFQFDYVDEEKTERKQLEEEAKVAPVFNRDPDVHSSDETENTSHRRSRANDTY